ncbi:MAG: hypothetical protein GY851_20285 [bacterium]|nr:hypothetical protein [bacterium]
MLMIIVGGFLLGALLGFALGRRAVYVGLVFLTLGVGPFAALHVYENYFYTSGDTSSMGMLSTIALILFAPFGLLLIVFGLLRGE